VFTVLFAVGRAPVGWISQWSEMIEDPQQKIGRPRQLYPASATATTYDRRAEIAEFNGLETGAIISVGAVSFCRGPPR